MDFLQLLLNGEKLSNKETWQRFLDIPDDEVGKTLLAQWFIAQAALLGLTINEVNEALAERMRQDVLAKETSTAGNAAVEKALHKAASGEFEVSGNLLREHLVHEATRLKYVPIGIAKSAQAAAFGRRGANGKKKQGIATRKTVSDAAQRILKDWQGAKSPSGRRLAELVSSTTGIPTATCRSHLQALNLRKKKLA